MIFQRIFHQLRSNKTLIILCVEVIIMMMGIGLVSPILPQYARTFGVNMTMIGMLITVFGIARMLVDIPAGRLTDKIGRRPVLVVGPLILSLGSIGCAISDTYWIFLAFRFVQGIGSAMYTTAAMVMLADISTDENRGRLMSFYQGCVLLGAGLGPTMGGFIAQYFGLQAPFYVFAVMGGIASLWAYFSLPESRPAIIEPASKAERSTSNKPVKALLRNTDFILISLITFGVFVTRQGAQNQILPLLASDRLNSNEAQIGFALTVVALIQLVSIFVSGKYSDRAGRKGFITIGGYILVISLLMLTAVDSVRFLLLSCIVMGVGIGMCGTISSAYVADIIPRENYSIGMGTYRAISDLGFVLGPVFLGWLSDIHSFGLALTFNAIFLLVVLVWFQVKAVESRSPAY
jgi:multidrug resistance protein